MQDRLPARLQPTRNALTRLIPLVLRQFVDGRYRGRYFVLFAALTTVLVLPFLLTGTGGWALIAVGLPFLWLDWRHPEVFEALNTADLSSPTIPADEPVRLRAVQLGRHFHAIEIVATDRRITWGPRRDANVLRLGSSDRTHFDFAEVTRVQRDETELRIWVRMVTYSVRFAPFVVGKGYAAEAWFSYLQEVCPQAEFEVREPEVVRKSSLFKPAIIAAVGLAAGVPYVLFVWLAFRAAGWL